MAKKAQSSKTNHDLADITESTAKLFAVDKQKRISEKKDEAKQEDVAEKESLSSENTGDSSKTLADRPASEGQSKQKEPESQLSEGKGFFRSIKSALYSKQALGSGLQAGANAFG